MIRVCLVQKWIPHYRVRFLELLRARLLEFDIELDLVYGNAAPGVPAYDSVAFPWGTYIRTRALPVGRGHLYWQGVLRHTRTADLVIVEQANRVLANYPLLLLQWLGRRRVAFWGHGRNFEAAANGTARERFKRRLARLPVWWFAYTDMSEAALLDAGVDIRRVTVVNNAIDTTALAKEVEGVSETDLGRRRAELGIGQGPVALYIGTLYPEKRLDLLIEAADLIRARQPEFHLLVAGGGPQQAEVSAAAASRPWLHLLAPAFGPEKAVLFRMADALLMPGRVGLVVCDSFAAGLPMVTRAAADHAPEVAYLQDGENGVVVAEASAQAFADAVGAVLADTALRGRLAAGAVASRQTYTVEAMAERFAVGIASAVGVSM